MVKKKLDEKPAIEAERTSVEEPKQPRKQSSPGQQNRPINQARAVQKMAAIKSIAAISQSPNEAGASERRSVERAQASGEMQAVMGNTRLGQMMAVAEQQKKPVELPGDEDKDRPKDKSKTPAKPAPLPPITTPLPQGAVRNKSGAAELTQGGVNITILPDQYSSKKLMVDGVERDAVTRPSLTWGTPKNFGIEDGKITNVDPVPPVTMTIQTTYGPGVKASDKSAYGRGTTAEDVKAGKTTLGHHEGSHGQDALQYAKDHPLPPFTGKSGMTEDEYKQAEKDYNDAMQAYNKDMAATSKKQTDCVGTPDEGCE